MDDFIFKLKILHSILMRGYDEWLKEIWRKDLDENYCCSGIEGGVAVCGCGGMTVREIYEPTTTQKGE